MIDFIRRIWYTPRIVKEITSGELSSGITFKGPYYNGIKEKVFFDPTYSKDEYGFTRNLFEKHKFDLNVAYSYYLFSILHEIGHAMTDVEESDEDLSTRALCAMIPKDFVKDREDLQDTYYDLPGEWAATEWAIQWIKENPCIYNYYSDLVDY